jgi:hypothetical protein
MWFDFYPTTCSCVISIRGFWCITQHGRICLWHIYTVPPYIYVYPFFVDFLFGTIMLGNLKGHGHRFSGFFLYSMQCIIDVFLIVRQNAHVVWPVNLREIQSSNSLLCKHVSIHLYRHVFSMGLDTLSYLRFKSIFWFTSSFWTQTKVVFSVCHD